MSDFSPTHITATSLPDAWFQAVYKCLEVGKEFVIDKGSYEGQKRLEFDYITVHIKNPGAKPLLPKLPAQYNIPDPVEDEYLDKYMPYLMTGELKPGEAYSYGERLTKTAPPIDWFSKCYNEYKHIVIQDVEVWANPTISKYPICNCFNAEFLDQIKLLIWTYKNKGFRNNQMVLQVAHPTDMLLQDPPCLRHIDTRIQDGRLHFIVYFRSWDLWGGFPANLAAIQQMKEYIASEIGVEDGEIIASSKGLHLYNYVWELAEILRGKTIDQFKKGDVNG